MNAEETYRAQLLAYALTYVTRGWSIAPLRPVTYYVNAHGKLAKTIRPLVSWKNDKPVDTVDEVRYWFGGGCSATYGLAVITGPSGVLMLDEDSYKAEFGASMELPAGAWIEQGGQGGRHVYVRNALGARNTAGTLAPGVDTRGEGGLSIAAPTWTFFPDGRATQWLPVEPITALRWPASLPLAEQGTPMAAATKAPRARTAAPGEPEDVSEEWARFDVERKCTEWCAVKRGSGLHVATSRFLGSLLRYLLATGVPADELEEAAEPWLERHPDWAGSIEAWDSLPSLWEWNLARAVEEPWRFAPAGLDARFPWPELIPAAPALTAPPADRIGWELSRLAMSSRAEHRARLASLRSQR